SEFFLRPLAEVEALFRDCPNAVANTLALAERCRGFDLTRDLGYRFPDFNGAERAPAPRALAELCRARLEERYPPDSPHRDAAERRLAEELRLVEHHALSGFFLVYHDLFDLAREVAVDVRRGSRRAQGGLLPGRGRGSAGICRRARSSRSRNWRTGDPADWRTNWTSFPDSRGDGARRSGKSCASSPRRSRGCRGTFPSTWAGWSSRAGRSWRSCRSSAPPWKTGWYASGTRMPA